MCSGTAVSRCCVADDSPLAVADVAAALFPIPVHNHAYMCTRFLLRAVPWTSIDVYSACHRAHTLLRIMMRECR
jgi:hypothetical protein